jgi:hypothetical protein
MIEDILCRVLIVGGGPCCLIFAPDIAFVWIPF